MFPLWDNIPSERTPFVNYSIVIACAFVFFVELQAQQGATRLITEFGLIPLRVTHPNEKEIIVEHETKWGGVEREVVDIGSAVPPLLTLFTSLFLHGGWMHVIGNLWFLLIFGDNVEDRFGHIGYVLMYLVCGLAAGILHIVSDANSLLPTIGASGAIAGVMGAYLFLYPKAVVMTLVPLGIFTRLMPIPAPIFLGIWFLIQIISGVFTEQGGGGVAWWAHIGGFAAGLAMTAGMRRIGALNPPPRPDPVANYGQSPDRYSRWR